MVAAPSRPGDSNEVVQTVWRAESARLIAALIRMTRDVSLAEDLAQDALVAALERWPAVGVPEVPIAWLMTVAKRRAIEHFRRSEVLRRKVVELGLQEKSASALPDLEGHIDYIEDDVLRLLFICCHPTLTPESRAALTLRLVGGLTTAEIARGFFVTESTMGQRISRAKKTLAEAHARFELPEGSERTARINDVMAVIYLIFNEGYAATTGQDWMRVDLVQDATGLARMLADLAPEDPEAQALLSLLQIQGSRMAARLDEDGSPILLEEQDRGLWDHALVQRGLAALERAEELAALKIPVGHYFLQAKIAAEHARAVRADETDWHRIAALYDVLSRMAPGPVVEVNRAVAYGRAFGADAGLALLGEMREDALGDSPLLLSVRGDLFERAGRHDQAMAAFAEAAARSGNASERAVLLRRASQNRSTS